MEKFKNFEVKPFSFSDLESSKIIEKSEFKSFKFNQLDDLLTSSQKVSAKELQEERIYEKKNNFRIEDVVRESRGISLQEKEESDSLIEAEVRKRLDLLREDSYKEGFLKGEEEGKSKAYDHYNEELQAKINDFSQTLESLKCQIDSLIIKNRKDIFEFVKRFTKWIVLKEVSDDLYLEKLLEKLILELNARNNLLIKIGKAHFSEMPLIVESIEAKLGKLSNLRIEIVPEINYPGIILESENGLIDGSLEGVFEGIDKIFNQVINHEA